MLAAAISLVGCAGSMNKQPYYRFTPTPDTLMLGANDTFNLVDLSGNQVFFGELYSYNITLQATQAGDTASTVIMILQETNELGGTNWYELERDTATTGTTIRIHGGSNTAPGLVKGYHLRIILDDVGGSGLDSTIYNLDAILKQ